MNICKCNISQKYSYKLGGKLEYSVNGRYGAEGGRVKPGRSVQGISAIFVKFLIT